jgi:type IX secretion system PorP/SprF family membrane protein
MNHILSLFIALFCTISLFGQDKHFSQFYATPIALNPAMSGLMEGRYRIGVNYRDQGRGTLDFPMRTFAGSFDLKFDVPTQSQYKDSYGVGLLFYSDRVSGFDFNTTNMSVAGAYHKALNLESNQYLSLGFQAGVIQRSVTYDNFVFQDQFNGTTGFTFNTREPLPANNISFGDFSTGVQFTSAPTNRVGFYVGGTIQHITAPTISLKVYNTNINKMYRLYSVYGGMTIPVGYNLQITPRVFAAAQGPHLEGMVGSNFRFAIDEKTAFIAGPWVRLVRNDRSGSSYSFSDAIALVGFEYNKINLSFSYDTSFGAYRNRFGAFELAISYIGNYDNDDDFCPKF